MSAPDWVDVDWAYGLDQAQADGRIAFEAGPRGLPHAMARSGGLDSAILFASGPLPVEALAEGAPPARDILAALTPREAAANADRLAQWARQRAALVVRRDARGFAVAHRGGGPDIVGGFATLADALKALDAAADALAPVDWGAA